jgi:hypothetical protein
MATIRKISDDEKITEAICGVRAAAEAAHNAAVNLNTMLLDLRPGFAPEGALIRDSANFLQHLVQVFRHRAAPNLRNAKNKGKTLGFIGVR